MTKREYSSSNEASGLIESRDIETNHFYYVERAPL